VPFWTVHADLLSTCTLCFEDINPNDGALPYHHRESSDDYPFLVGAAFQHSAQYRLSVYHLKTSLSGTRVSFSARIGCRDAGVFAATELRQTAASQVPDTDAVAKGTTRLALLGLDLRRSTILGYGSVPSAFSARSRSPESHAKLSPSRGTKRSLNGLI